MLQIDIRAPTIPLDQRVWRLFPGSGYQFLETFIDSRAGFLDFPGLELPRGKLQEAKDWIPRIARSQFIASTLRQAGTDAKFDAELSKFANARATQNRGRLRSAIINFYGEAKDGDFVVLPEPVFLSKVHVGRLKGNDVTRAHFPRWYGKTSIPARHIEWLGQYRESAISPALSNSLRHQHPFTLLEKSVQLEVFSLAYGSFVFGERHAAIFNEKNDFLDTDAALLGIVSRLAAAACRAVDERKSRLAAADLIDVLLRAPPIEYTCTQEADIHSAGFNRYISGTMAALVIGAVIAGLIGLAWYSSKEKLAADISAVSIVNTSPNADPQCTARVSKASAMVLQALGTDRTWALCEAAKAAAARAGFRSTASPSRKK